MPPCWYYECLCLSMRYWFQLRHLVCQVCAMTLLRHWFMHSYSLLPPTSAWRVFSGKQIMATFKPSQPATMILKVFPMVSFNLRLPPCHPRNTYRVLISSYHLMQMIHSKAGTTSQTFNACVRIWKCRLFLKAGMKCLLLSSTSHHTLSLPVTKYSKNEP